MSSILRGLLPMIFLGTGLPAGPLPEVDVTPHAAITGQQSPGSATPVETQTEDIGVTEAATTVQAPSGHDRMRVSADVPPLAVVGVTWNDLGAAVPAVRIRSLERGRWTGWTDVETGSATPGSERRGSEPIAVLDATRIEIELTAPAGAVPDDAQVHVVDPGRSEADDEAAPAAPVTLTGGRTAPFAAATAGTGVPSVLPRSAWGADETMRTRRPELGRVTGAVIHHTAGRNDYTAQDVPAIIRGMYSYHAVSLGWGDIGYNAVVDKFGRIWEGRFGGITHPLVGAHAAGVNSTMFGISLMGDYSSVAVPDVAMRAMAQMTAWKFAVHGISPQGSAVGLEGEPLSQRVIGHRDVAATVCPGQAFYDRMGELRALVDRAYATMPTYAQPDPYTVRLAGADRFATSAAASEWIFRRPEVVYVATGSDYADALAASPAAALTGSPVLLVRPDRVPPAATAELTRMKPATIRVLGGSAAVSEAVLTELRRLSGTVDVVAGADRFGTAALMSGRSWPTGARTVYLASGHSAPDALGAAAAAAQQSAPLLLVRHGELPQATAEDLVRLAPDGVVVVGGTSAVSDSVLADLAHLLPAADITRVAGADRYETSARLVERLWDRAAVVFHATGATWPDALSASSAAAEKNAPLLLLKTTCTPAVVQRVRDRLDPAHEYIVGGAAAVADGASGRPC